MKRNNIVSHGEIEKTVDLRTQEPSRNKAGELSQFDNKKPEELESEFDHFDGNNSYQTSVFKGRNIVDLDFVYKQLLDGHKACKTTLSLTQYQRKRLIGLTSILYLSLMVKTSVYDDNTCAADTYTKFLL